jgi:hypothetical protein
LLIRVAITDEVLTLDHLKPDAERAIATARDSDAKEIEISVKAGKAQGGYLNKERAVEMVEMWLDVQKRAASEDEVAKKIVVSGYDGSGGRLEFDILKDKLEMAMEVDVYSDADEYYHDRVAQIRRSWELQKTKLRERSKRARESADEEEAAVDGSDG